MPKVQAILKETMNDKELNVHLNGDEAMSFGSAFIASNSSSSFKVRKVYLTQHPKYDVRVKIAPLDAEAADLRRQKAAEAGEDEEDSITYEKETVLYKRSDFIGQKKTIHLNYDVDMLIQATAIHPDGTEEELVRFELKDVSKIMEKEPLQSGNVTKPKVSLTFELSRSHLFSLNSAKLSVDETVLEEIIPEKKETEKDDKEDKEDSENEEEIKEDAEAESEPAEEASDEAAEEKEPEPEPEKEYKEVIKPHSFTLDDVSETHIGARLLDNE